MCVVGVLAIRACARLETRVVLANVNVTLAFTV